MAHTFKAAAVLASPYMFDLDRTVEKCCNMVDEAAAQGARLIAFPETFLPLYPWWIWMAVNNVERGHLYKQLYDQSVELDGLAMQRLCQKAKEKSVFIVVGINEKDHGTIYNSQVFINEHGEIVRCRRKLIPTGEERTLWGRGDGSDLMVLNTSLGRLGGLICYENIMPLARYTLYSKHEQVHIANWPGNNLKSQPRDRTAVIKTTSRFAAIEGQMFVIASSSCIGAEEVEFYKKLDPGLGAKLTVGGGVAAIYSPFGEVLACIEDQEGIAYADIDLDQIPEAKHLLDTVGHYARPDVNRVLFDGGVRKMPVVPIHGKAPAAPQEDAPEEEAADTSQAANP